MPKIDAELKKRVSEDVSLGSHQESLGIQKMPPGYALMRNNDGTHYYWLRHDGVDSVIHYDKWAAYRMAREDFGKPVKNPWG